MKTSRLTRRDFLSRSAGGAAGLALFGRLHLAGSPAPSQRVVVGVIGLGRGNDHVTALLSLGTVEIAYVCDVDQQRIDRSLKAVNDRQERKAKGVQDFRRILDDPAVDAVTLATPNHWHAPATILACAAGKHVYVEKPGSHNPQEGEWMVAAARKHRRVVQMGNQRRSWPAVREMVDRLQSGVIGRPLYARCYYTNARASIGRGRRVPVPANLDYSLWQGPAPEQPYVDNLIHYNWHWRWHWGGGELANNGIHCLDLARWGLDVVHPRRVTFNGGRYHYADDQETPDTGTAVFDFGTSGIQWDCSSCLPRSDEALPFVSFHGAGGTVLQAGSGYRVLDPQGNETARGTGPGGDKSHFENFIEAIRKGVPLHSEIAEGQRSTLLCHLGNIAYRTGQALTLDPATASIRGNRKAMQLWHRDYRAGWRPKV